MLKIFSLILWTLTLAGGSNKSLGDIQISTEPFSQKTFLHEKIKLLENLATEGADLEFFSVKQLNEKDSAARHCRVISAKKALQEMKQILDSVCLAVSTSERPIHMEDREIAELADWVGTDYYSYCYGSTSLGYSLSDYASFKKIGENLWVEFEIGTED